MKTFRTVSFYLLFTILSSTSLADDNPIVVLVPAAWHSPIHYAEYFKQLNLAGYDTISLRLPSCDSSLPKDQSVSVDAAFVSQYLLMPSINAGRRVVLVMHSYSGGPGAMAAKGLSVAERSAAGQSGGIIGLIFISAFLAQDGQSLLSAGGGKFSPWVIEYPDDQLGVSNPEEVFYNGVPKALSIIAVAEIRNQSRYSAITPCGPPAWSDPVYNDRRAYVLCTLDNTIPPAAQQAMLQQSQVRWNVVSFNTGHAPFLSQPKELTTWTVAEIARFDATNRARTIRAGQNPQDSSSAHVSQLIGIV